MGFFHHNGDQPAGPPTWDQSIPQFLLNLEVHQSCLLELDAGLIFPYKPS